MAGPSRAAPPMPDPFDPAEFDAPPPADPGTDYRVLRDAMRQAGAEGIAQQSAALVQRNEQGARQRIDWGQWRGAAVGDLESGYRLVVACRIERVDIRESVTRSTFRGSWWMCVWRTVCT